MKKGKQKVVRLRVKSWAWIGSITAALTAAVVVFGVMLQMEKNLLADYEKGDIFVAAQEIPKGEVLTQDNYHLFLEMKQLDKSCIPPTAISTAEQIEKLAARYPIEQGTLITLGMFQALNEEVEDMEEAVIAGFKAEDLYQVVGGVLRSGDRIHIYQLPQEEGETTSWQNVYVQQVFDGFGKTIPSGDEVTAAQRVNIFLEKEDVELFYSALEKGKLRVVKVCP